MRTKTTHVEDRYQHFAIETAEQNRATFLTRSSRDDRTLTLKKAVSCAINVLFIKQLEQGGARPYGDGTASKLEFHGLGRRDVVGVFDGGEITGDAGGIVLREVERRTHILGRLAGCFEDHRRADRVEHPVERLVKQRVPGICLGYEDLDDHDGLCRDRLLALLCECGDIDGAGRRQEADRSKPLAGKSTLNRLELTPAAGPEARYKKTVADTAAMDALLVDLFLESREAPPAAIVLDVDATATPCTAARRGGSSAATTTATAICRCTCSAAGICCARGCAARRWTRRTARSGSWSGSCRGSGRGGRRCGSRCGATAASAGRRSWRGARRRAWTTRSAWRRTAA